MKDKKLDSAIKLLSEEFVNLDWNYKSIIVNGEKALLSLWPGNKNEDIMICVSNGIHEQFHRQEFFFFNYAYKSDYTALSENFENKIVIKEGECYIGQPFAGYSLITEKKDNNLLIMGILIKKECFFRNYLPILSANDSLFKFFLNPKINRYSDEFIHLKLNKNPNIKPLIDMMIIEYANRSSDTQNMLKPLVLALMMNVMRQYKIEYPRIQTLKLHEKFLKYINEHIDNVTLGDISDTFSYHPNYISALLHKKTGKTFSQIVLQLRMERALMLLKETNISVEEIALMTGYTNTSNFYKAFKCYYKSTPRKV